VYFNRCFSALTVRINCCPNYSSTFDRQDFVVIAYAYFQDARGCGVQQNDQVVRTYPCVCLEWLTQHRFWVSISWDIAEVTSMATDRQTSIRHVRLTHFRSRGSSGASSSRVRCAWVWWEVRELTSQTTCDSCYIRWLQFNFHCFATTDTTNQ
jgi:hypothetical protein